MPANNSVDLRHAIGLPPDEAIAYFESKGYTFGFNWHDVEASAHANAFTVAGVLKQDVLEDIRKALSVSLKDGGTLADFQKNLIPTLEQKGWMGKGLVADADGVLQGKQLTPRRLETIFQTNMQAAYNAGRYQEQRANAESRPYLERVAIADSRTRPAHLALNGFIAHIDDPIWATLYPPDGYCCRCRVRARSARDVERHDLTVHTSEGRLVEVEQAWGNGETRTVTAFKNPINGQLYTPDAGFGHNPGQGYLSSLGQHLLDRSAVASTSLASQAVQQTLSHTPVLNALSKDVNTFVNNVLLNQQARGAQRHVGALPPEVINRLSESGIAPQSAVITLTDNHLLKSLPNTAGSLLPETFLQQLPEHLYHPTAILRAIQKENPALVYVLKSEEQVIAMTMDVPVAGTGGKMKTNQVTGARVLTPEDNLGDTSRYQLLWGRLDD